MPGHRDKGREESMERGPLGTVGLSRGIQIAPGTCGTQLVSALGIVA